MYIYHIYILNLLLEQAINQLSFLSYWRVNFTSVHIHQVFPSKDNSQVFLI